jgi:hypothetical protein
MMMTLLIRDDGNEAKFVVYVGYWTSNSSYIIHWNTFHDFLVSIMSRVTSSARTCISFTSILLQACHYQHCEDAVSVYVLSVRQR